MLPHPRQLQQSFTPGPGLPLAAGLRLGKVALTGGIFLYAVRAQGDELAQPGLYIELRPRGYHFFPVVVTKSYASGHCFISAGVASGRMDLVTRSLHNFSNRLSSSAGTRSLS